MRRTSEPERERARRHQREGASDVAVSLCRRFAAPQSNQSHLLPTSITKTGSGDKRPPILTDGPAAAVTKRQRAPPPALPRGTVYAGGGIGGGGGSGGGGLGGGTSLAGGEGRQPGGLSAPAFQFQLPPWGEPHAGLPPPPTRAEDLPPPGAGGFVCLLACDPGAPSLPRFDERANAAAAAAHASRAAAASVGAAADAPSSRRSSSRVAASAGAPFLDLSRATTAQIAAAVAASAPRGRGPPTVPAPDVPWSRQGLPTGAAPRRKPVGSGWSGGGGGAGGGGGGGGGGVGGGGKSGRPSAAAAGAGAGGGASASTGAARASGSRPSSRSGGGGSGGSGSGSFPVGVRQPQADAMLRDHLLGKSVRAPWREMGAPRRPIIA